MYKPKVVLFGSIGLAKDCLEKIILRRDIEFLGACCVPLENTWRSKEETVYNYCLKNDIPILKMDDIKKLNPDIGFSIRFNQIIPKDIIDRFNKGIFNTHGGILPNYRGVYSNINALINGENEYGVTLHYVTPGIDDGDIVEVKKINIEDRDTGFTLYKKGEKLCYEVLDDNIDKIINNSNSKISQERLIKKGLDSNTYTFESTIKLKEIDLEKSNKKLISRIIRAFDSPYHEPSYTIINDEKIYLRVGYGVNDI